MAKLYPPYIEGTIPAFYADGNQAILTVPFSMNKAVSIADFTGIALKVKTVQTNEFIYSATTANSEIDYLRTNFKANFTINLTQNPKFKIGQFYKIQIAYCGSDAARTPGYYSTVGVVKFTTYPSVKIADLMNFSTHRMTYTGVYSQTSEDSAKEMDVSEKVYEYCFNLYEDLDNSSPLLVASSEWQLHNSSTDIVNYESTDEYSFTYSLKQNKYYHVEYIVRTINGLEVSSGTYTVMDKAGTSPEIDAILSCRNDFENGYVSLTFIPNDPEHNYANGSFLLSRSSSEDNFTNWYPLQRFTLRNADKLNTWEYKDFTVQHGLKYIYAVQQYNSKGLYSTRLYAIDKNGNTYIEPDFEDSFLYDGKRQLKIRFNPKVSSFKTDLMENKMETIGSKYPFIFRNSKVEYKEFPIAGLISYHSDEANLFMNDEDLGLATNYTQKPRSEISRTKAFETSDLYLRSRTTAYSTYNIAAERIFKLSVLEWLNNGKPKLFRSPTEGNYIVRLMNVSLTPEDKTGRMIHSFQCTAYEISDCNHKTLNSYGIIQIDEPAETQYRLLTIGLADPAVRNYYANSATSAVDIQYQQAEQSVLISHLQYQLAIAEDDRRDAATQYSQILNDYYLNNIGSPSTIASAQALLREKQDACTDLEEQIRQAQAEAVRLAGLTTYKKLNEHEIYEYIEFRDCIPGTTFYIRDITAGGVEESIVIGVTGSYTKELKGHRFSSIRVEEDENGDIPPFGLITYKYLATVQNNFEKIYDINYEQVVARQFIGPVTIINTQLPSDEINDIKRTLISLYYTNFKARIVSEVYKDDHGDIWKWENSGTSIAEHQGAFIPNDKLDPLIVYKVHRNLHAWEYAQWRFVLSKNDYDWVPIDSLDYTITVDNETLTLLHDNEEELLNHLIQFFDDQTFYYLHIGSGIILDCAYATTNVTYNVEVTDEDLQEEMSLYLLALEMYNDPTNENAYQKDSFYYGVLKPQWQAYCDLLEQKLRE